MYLVDTCGWIEWMTDAPLSKNYSRHLNAPDSLIVPTLVTRDAHFATLPQMKYFQKGS